MSKKSRKRNKRLLALAGIITAGTLAAKNKRNKAIEAGVASDDSESAMAPTVIIPKKKPDSTMPDNLSKNMGKDNKRPYSMEGKFGTITKTDDSGKKTTKKITPFKDSGLTLGVSKRKVDKTANAVAKAERDTSEGMLPPQLQNPGRTNITTKQGDFRRGFKNLGNTIFPKANFKSGGRVKGCGIAKRGFGRAMKGKK